MRWTVTTNSVSNSAVMFCKSWLGMFNCESLDRIVLKRGKLGYGVYGWCDYIDTKSRPYEIVLHVPGPFPHSVSTNQPSILMKVYGLRSSIPDGQTPKSKDFSLLDETVKVRLETRTILKSSDEGLAFLFGHELFHYLSSEDQIDDENTEDNADAYGRLLLDRFRKS